MSLSKVLCASLLAACVMAGGPPARAESPHRVTIIVDAFGDVPAVHHDWGFAALVEYGGKRILFDTGNDAAVFARNADALGIDLTRLDFAVISHRHGDHTDGLRHLLAVNPKVTIYVPDDEYFGGAVPATFFERPVTSLPARMRYFGGRVPAVVGHGTPWRGAHFVAVPAELEVAPGMRVVRNAAAEGSFASLPELSLVIDGPAGQLVVVGCSHPGIETILRSTGAPRRPVDLVVGGLHLVTANDAQIERALGVLRTDMQVKRMAPAHCTGEPAFAALLRAYGDQYLYAGAGSVVDLPVRP
jgi:7,8-dihydropterin-6-yl-methyl-4-(beta-D-ribofuranosyl)aminobenzene 5'-phosphate synthase